MKVAVGLVAAFSPRTAGFITGKPNTFRGSQLGRHEPTKSANDAWALAAKAKKDAGPAVEIPLDDVIVDVEKVRAEAMSAVEAAADPKALNEVRVTYLGKKGPLQAFMAMMRSLSNEDKPKLGQVVNVAKQELEDAVAEKAARMEAASADELIANEYIDVTLPGLELGGRTLGHRHPLSLTMEKATNIFRRMGYDVITGAEMSPEIEDDYYCFTALNCPPDHPARDMQDTFYLSDNVDEDGNQRLLRTHTSAVQIREMERRVKAGDLPFKIVAPGRVYRKDEIDATHSPIFHQIEILALDEKGKLSVSHLKGTIEYFLKQMFGSDIDVRYRGSFFPFTEPSMEVDVFYGGRWLEVLGCGMVDPRVLRMAGVDPEKYGGFAAGFGVERFAMVIHGIPDIRAFYQNDIRFLSQFSSQGFELGDEDFELDDAAPNFDPATGSDRSAAEWAPGNGHLWLGGDSPVALDPALAVKLEEKAYLYVDKRSQWVREQSDLAKRREVLQSRAEKEPQYPPAGPLAQDWDFFACLLEEFAAAHGGSTAVPWDFKAPAAMVEAARLRAEGQHGYLEDDAELWRWCDLQRRCHDSGDLKPACKARLDELGFAWGDGSFSAMG